MAYSQHLHHVKEDEGVAKITSESNEDRYLTVLKKESKEWVQLQESLKRELAQPRSWDNLGVTEENYRDALGPNEIMLIEKTADIVRELDALYEDAERLAKKLAPVRVEWKRRKEVREKFEFNIRSSLEAQLEKGLVERLEEDLDLTGDDSNPPILDHSQCSASAQSC